ncbi:MAG: MerR family DNA-binding transcriptional regulator [Pirellulaceae bacterium]|nr:MerR family DNA-binding transcriptional regulator [Pirellulaceae bacterium]
MAQSNCEFITIAEASKLLGVAPNTLRSWGALGKIEEYRHPMNNYRLYKVRDIEKLELKLRAPIKSSKLKHN